MDGWIKLYRKIKDSSVFQNEGLLKVWIWCLIKAAHKKTWVSVKTGKGSTEIQLLPGQFIFGRKSAAKELKMKLSTVRNRIKKLEHLGNLKIHQKDKQYSVITLVNWHFFQSSEKKDIHKDIENNPKSFANSDICQSKIKNRTSKRTLKGHRKDTNNNDNNVNEKTYIFGYQKRKDMKSETKNYLEGSGIIERGNSQIKWAKVQLEQSKVTQKQYDDFVIKIRKGILTQEEYDEFVSTVYS